MKNLIIYSFLFFGLINGQTRNEIEKAKNYIKREGLSESQVRSLAKSQGYSDKQIDEAAKKIKQEDKVTKSIAPNDTPVIKTDEKSINNPFEIKSTEELEKNKKMVVSNESKVEIFRSTNQAHLNHYGYDIFKRDPALFQGSAVGAVDPDYIIGPGDQIIVMLWGETQFRQVLTVNREGFIFIPDIGQVFVNGLDLKLLESKLFRVLSQSYASLNPLNRKATTFLDVSLGDLRPLRVQVLGHVAQPGAYTISPSATLFSSLYYFNGPTELGSLRDIKLIRSGEEILSIDFYDFLQTGKKPKDQKLLLNDVIFIPKRKKTVGIEGEINLPAIFELNNDETLSDLIEIAGGIKVTAYLERVQVDRIVPFEDRIELGMDRMLIDVNLRDILDKKENFKIKDGDHVKIFSIKLPRPNTVHIEGAISRPGDYELNESMSLRDLIIASDSLLGDAYLDRADIIRLNEDYKTKLIELNLGKALSGDKTHNIALKSNDEIKIYSKSEMEPSKFVTISGHIKEPGKYLLREDMKINDLIFLAGGFFDEDYLKKTYLNRADLIRFKENRIDQSIISFSIKEVLSNPQSEFNYKLKSDDHIEVYPKKLFKKTARVFIDGEINSPGSYNLKDNMSLGDLIMEAGGVPNDLFKYRAEIARIDTNNINRNVFAETMSLDIDFNELIQFSDENLNNKLAFKLSAYDHITIRPDPLFVLQRKVQITGAVNYPGIYILKSPNETLSSIISRSGGLKKSAFKEASLLIRDEKRVQIDLEKILKKKSSKFDIAMIPGDKIVVSTRPNMIQILGEVNSPGYYKYLPNRRVNDAISQAGGFSDNANESNVFIKYPNGTSVKYSRWLKNAKVMDGSIIEVGKKPEEEPFDKTEYAKELTSILANLAQAFSIIMIARN